VLDIMNIYVFDGFLTSQADDSKLMRGVSKDTERLTKTHVLGLHMNKALSD
jgi:hypothetical protein